MDWLRENIWSLWLGLGVLLGIAEMLSLDLVLLMLALGALVGMALALAGLPIGLQLVGAAVAAIATLGLLRPKLIKKLHAGPELTLGHNKLIGAHGLVTSEITPTAVGQIKIGGEIWTAAAYDNLSVITPGQAVEVMAIKGATAYVYPVPGIESAESS